MVKLKLVAMYDGFYRVGTDGSVWTCRIPGRGKDKKGPWRKLKLSPHCRSGHLLVALSKDRNQTHYYVHRLVLEAFVGPCPDGMEARHYPDRNPANNHLENLQWATYRTNQIDRAEHGTSNRGERCAAAKLKETDVKKIRRMWEGGNYNCAELARLYGMSLSAIWNIVRRNNWKHI